MTTRIQGRRLLAATAVQLSLVLVVAACATTLSSPTATADPAGPTAAPSGAVPPTPTPRPQPSVGPRASASPMVPAVVVLDVAPPHRVSVIVDDTTGRLEDIESGRAGDGMSVRWGDSVVENVDDDTLRVTWVGLPLDEELHLQVGEAPGDRVAFTFTQAAPPAYSDAVGFDRVLVVRFDGPIDAGSIDVSFEQEAD